MNELFESELSAINGGNTYCISPLEGQLLYLLTGVCVGLRITTN